MYQVLAFRYSKSRKNYDGQGSKDCMLIREVSDECEAHRIAKDLVESKGYQYASIENKS